MGYRSTWPVIISIGPEKHISVDPYSKDKGKPEIASYDPFNIQPTSDEKLARLTHLLLMCILSSHQRTCILSGAWSLEGSQPQPHNNHLSSPLTKQICTFCVGIGTISTSEVTSIEMR